LGATARRTSTTSPTDSPRPGDAIQHGQQCSKGRTGSSFGKCCRLDPVVRCIWPGGVRDRGSPDLSDRLGRSVLLGDEASLEEQHGDWVRVQMGCLSLFGVVDAVGRPLLDFIPNAAMQKQSCMPANHGSGGQVQSAEFGRNHDVACFIPGTYPTPAVAIDGALFAQSYSQSTSACRAAPWLTYTSASAAPEVMNASLSSTSAGSSDEEPRSAHFESAMDTSKPVDNQRWSYPVKVILPKLPQCGLSGDLPAYVHPAPYNEGSSFEFTPTQFPTSYCSI